MYQQLLSFTELYHWYLIEARFFSHLTVCLAYERSLHYSKSIRNKQTKGEGAPRWPCVFALQMRMTWIPRHRLSYGSFSAQYEM